MSPRIAHRTKRRSRRRTPPLQTERRPADYRVVAVYRRSDDTVCHARCRRPLSFQGIRAHLEADFYCYTCLTHVAIPLAVLDLLPVRQDDAVDATLEVPALSS